MGAFGTGPLDNDDALDLLSVLEDGRFDEAREWLGDDSRPEYWVALAHLSLHPENYDGSLQALGHFLSPYVPELRYRMEEVLHNKEWIDSWIDDIRPVIRGLRDALPQHCPVCHRLIEDPSHGTRHHWVPKSRGGKFMMPLHRMCHQTIHSLFSNARLEKQLATPQALRAHPKLQPYLSWIRSKPSAYYDRSRKSVMRKREGA